MSGSGPKGSGPGPKGSGSGASGSRARGSSDEPPPELVTFGSNDSFTFQSMTARNTYAILAHPGNPFRDFLDRIITEKDKIARTVEFQIQTQLRNTDLRVRPQYQQDRSDNKLIFEFRESQSGNMIGHFTVHLKPVENTGFVPQAGAFHVRSQSITNLLTRYVIVNISGVVQFSRVHIYTRATQPVRGGLTNI